MEPNEEDEFEKKSTAVKRYIDEMSGEQLARFEFFVRSHFTKKKIKDIISSAGREEVSDEVAIVVASLAKLFVGELVEVSCDVVKENGGEGKLEPRHIREGFRRMQNAGSVGHGSESAFLFGPQEACIPVCDFHSDLLNDET